MTATPGDWERLCGGTDGPLSGLRVLEVGHLVAGPYAGSLLADLGASVLRIEDPRHGDALRGMTVAGQPWFWMVEARNKLCISLNLRTASGRELFLALVAQADVLIENFRPGTLDAWGLTERQLREANDGLILTRVSGFGQDGPYRDEPSTDRQALAFSGVGYLTGHPESAPVRTGVAVSDYVAGLHAAVATLAALRHRDTAGGPGQSIDVSLYDGMLRMTADLVQEYRCSGSSRVRSGNRNPAVPGGVFATSDGGWLSVAASTDRLWQALTKALERPDLAESEQLRTNEGRRARSAELEGVLADWIATRPAADAEQSLVRHGVPARRLYTAADIAEDAHIRARQSLVEVPTARGPLTMPSVVPRFSRTPGSVRSAGAEHGAHNELVYSELLGLETKEIDELRELGII